PIPHPVQPLSTLRTPRCRDARKTRSRPAYSALNGPDLHWQAHSSFLSHPAPGSCRRSNVTGIRGLAAHAVPVRRQATLVTCLVRHGVRGMPCHLPSLQPGPFPPPPPPPFITGLFGRFIGTTSPSDSSPVPRQLRLLAFLPRPGIAAATAGQTRSPRFQRDPFVRDVASDPGRATAPRMTTPHMLPSTPLTVSAPAK